MLVNHLLCKMKCGEESFKEVGEPEHYNVIFIVMITEWGVAGGDISCYILASGIKGTTSGGGEPWNRAGRPDKFLSRIVGHWSRSINTHRKCAHDCCHQDGQPSRSGVWCMCVDCGSCCRWAHFDIRFTRIHLRGVCPFEYWTIYPSCSAFSRENRRFHCINPASHGCRAACVHVDNAGSSWPLQPAL